MTRGQSSAVITITTDFGHKGPFAAIMKGVILQRLADAKVVDLAHDIPAHWPPEAGFWISRSYPYFPKGSVHVAIVDPGVGTDREIIVVECDDHVFLAPDNGLLGPLLSRSTDFDLHRLDPNKLGSLDLPPPSLTFHGRDIFAPIAAEIAAGRLAPSDIGLPTNDWTPGWIDDPEVIAGKVRGVIVTIDAFGNLISNVDAALLESMQQPVVSFAGHRLLRRFGNEPEPV